MTVKFLIDDIRDIGVDVIARNIIGARTVYQNNDITGWTLFLDHDLGIPESGLDVIREMIALNNVPERVIIVSSNPVGRDNIGHALTDIGYIRKSPHEFYREPTGDVQLVNL